MTANKNQDLHEYLLSVSVEETDALKRLRKETAGMKNAKMQISPEQGKFLYFLVKTLNASRILEVGVFTGYSSLWTSMALPEHGILTACDISREWTDIAGKYWMEASLLHKIDLRIGPASDTLDILLEEGNGESYDFAFIDADKDMYSIYYEKCLKLLRKGGIIALDNVLMGGKVFDPEEVRPSVVAMRDLNSFITRDERVEVSMLPIRDGLSLVLKK